MRRVGIVIFVLVVIGLVLGADLLAQAPAPTRKILVRAARPYGPVVGRIRSLGDTVTHQYEYIDAVGGGCRLLGSDRVGQVRVACGLAGTS